jgi:zeta-carotene desaturase
VRFAPVWERFTHAPITTIHLWFDRAVTDVEQCALLDTRIQWMFNKSAIRRDEPAWCEGGGQYLELVISASFAELKMGREEILSGALRELAMFFPRVREATVVKSGVLKEARATFSVVPGLDAVRPRADVGEGLYVAGDWCATGWPSTMEGGVRSGRIAAGAVVGVDCLAKELPASGLARMFVR